MLLGICVIWGIAYRKMPLLGQEIGPDNSNTCSAVNQAMEVE
jgi:hypothetical protein